MILILKNFNHIYSFFIIYFSFNNKSKEIMICYTLRISIFLFVTIIGVLYLNNRRKKREDFFIFEFNPLFTIPNFIKTGVYDKYQAMRTTDGYKISPDNAHDFNTTYGFGVREYDYYGKKEYSDFWREKKAKEKRKREEKLDVFELVPLIWQFQDRLFLEYRKYFDKVECLKHYYNTLKLSRNLAKPKVMEWHKENCDITLDLNHDIDEGDKQYVGLDGIRAKMKMSDTGK